MVICRATIETNMYYAKEREFIEIPYWLEAEEKEKTCEECNKTIEKYYIDCLCEECFLNNLDDESIARCW